MAHLLAKFGEAAIKWHRSSNGTWRKPMISAKVNIALEHALGPVA
jgi:hypothetical protein